MLVPSPHPRGGRMDDHVPFQLLCTNQHSKGQNLTMRALFGRDHSGIVRVSGMLGLSDK